MNKQEHIAYWIKIASKDLDMFEFLKDQKKFVPALFYGHLYLEKILKATWIKNNDNNVPPKTHNLLKLAKDAKIKIPDEQQEFLVKLNTYQIESRYPEDIDRLYEITTEQLVEDYFGQIKMIATWLKEQV